MVHLLGQGHLCQQACHAFRNSMGNIFGGQRIVFYQSLRLISCTEPGKVPISPLDIPGKSCRVSCLYSTTPLTLFKLIVINFDNFHLLSCLVTQQGVKSSSTTINFTMYFGEVLGSLGRVYRFQVPSLSPRSTFLGNCWMVQVGCHRYDFWE